MSTKLERYKNSIKRKVKKEFLKNANPLKKNLIEFDAVYHISQKTRNHKFDYYEFEGEKRGKDLLKIVKEFFDNNTCIFLYSIFDIPPIHISKEIDFDNIKLVGEKTEDRCIEFFEMDDFRILSDIIDDLEVKIYADYDFDTDIAEKINMEHTVLAINHFNPSMLVQFEFDYHPDIEKGVILDYSTRIINGFVYAIEKTSSIPLWVEYLIMSWSLYTDGNEKLAFFTAFAGFDKFIELQYSSLSQIYTKEIMKYQKSDEEVIDYYLNMESDYINMNRRIIQDKFHDIMMECGANIAPCYGDLFHKLDEYESVRNDVAHCETEYKNGQYKDLLFSIIRALYLLAYNEDVTCIYEVKKRLKKKMKK